LFIYWDVIGIWRLNNVDECEMILAWNRRMRVVNRDFAVLKARASVRVVA
jgi:hypothetical protein